MNEHCYRLVDLSFLSPMFYIEGPRPGDRVDFVRLQEGGWGAYRRNTNPPTVYAHGVRTRKAAIRAAFSDKLADLIGRKHKGTFCIPAEEDAS